ncbi:hypothetical protein PSHT_12045, partial [Puccinia striiformis]
LSSKPPVYSKVAVDDNNLAHNHLAEDIALLQADFENLPASPEITGKGTNNHHWPNNTLPPKSSLALLPTQQSTSPQLDSPCTVPTPPEVADVALAKEIWDFQTAGFCLEKQKLVHWAIQLYKNLEEIGRAIMANSTFSFHTCLDSICKKSGGNIILISTIDDSVQVPFESIDLADHNTGVASDLYDLQNEWMVINVSNIAIPWPFVDQAPLPPTTLLAIFILDNEIFDTLAFLAGIDWDECYNALTFYALTANECWQCDSNSFYTRNCSNGLIGPSGSESKQFPKDASPKDPPPPSQHQEHVQNLARYYRPWYSQGHHRQDQQSTSVTPQFLKQGGFWHTT